ncbi:MAG: diguanylate cyclase [Thermoanaerobaculia bacterium]|nr:diguanylate cyclase [Thermoanaerobaculia bacterium]
MIPARILLVDDQPENLKAIVSLFDRSAGRYEIYQTTLAVQALEIAREEQPDLVITDWDMPSMDGIELIEALKADPLTEDIPVIMCTGVMTSSTNLQTALEAGAADYIRKPVDAVELVARTQTMLRMGEMIHRIKEQNHALRHSYAILEEMSRTDPLTRLSNRRHLEERLAEAKSKADRTHDPFSVILCDLDRFKRFNDRHGHDCGDRILIEVGALLTDTARGYDHVGRWGGEEFLLVLPQTDGAGGSVVAEKIRTAVAEHPFVYDDVRLSVTLTLGVCEYTPGTTVEACIARADEALYSGKANGRNRVEVGERL